MLLVKLEFLISPLIPDQNIAPPDLLAILFSNMELRTGSLRKLDAGDNILAYGRFNRTCATIVVINCGEYETIKEIDVTPLGIPMEARLIRVMESSRQGFKTDNLGTSKKSEFYCNMGIKFFEWLRSAARSEFKKSKRFTPPAYINTTAGRAKDIVSIGNQTGEGWFLTGEMLELIEDGAKNIVCIQPLMPAEPCCGQGRYQEDTSRQPGCEYRSDRLRSGRIGG